MNFVNASSSNFNLIWESPQHHHKNLRNQDRMLWKKDFFIGLVLNSGTVTRNKQVIQTAAKEL